jgi:hypothetical protein
MVLLALVGNFFDVPLMIVVLPVGALSVIVVALMFANPALRLMDAKVAASEVPPGAEPMPLEPVPQARQCATMKAGL